MKEKFLYLTKPSIGGGGYLIPFENGLKNVSNEIDAMIRDGEVGEDLLITIVEHEREDFYNAPEFEGW